MLDSFSCTVWTPKGTITVEKNGDLLTVDAIAGGTLILPSGEQVALPEGIASYSLR